MIKIEDIQVRNQYRVIRDNNDPEATKVPEMPLIIVLDNGMVGEAKSIRGAATFVIGNEYLDTEDAIDEWLMRVTAARFEAMKALKNEQEVVVADSRKGIIPNNYAVSENDPDYIIDPDEDITDIERIYIDSDRLFLISLAQIGAIRILEREDSYLLRPHEKWTALKNSGGAAKNCSNCLHKLDGDGKIICPVYKMYCNEKAGTQCESYSIIPEQGQKEFTGGVYIDVCLEYGADELIELFRN